MADCKKYIEMISAFADGALSGNDKIELQKHLEACASCRSLLALYKGISEAAEESLVEPPEDFTGSVMDRIKKLPENEHPITNSSLKPKKSLKPVIISFVAAAACLALAFIVSPELFGLRSAREMSASIPAASAAPSDAAYGITSNEGAAEDSTPDAAAKSGDMTASGNANDNGNEVGSSQIMITEATDMPQPAPNQAPEIAQNMIERTDELKAYYAVFAMEGQLPDILSGYDKTDNMDGTFSIEISIETADQLILDGFKPVMGNSEAEKAIVKYTPPA